jgi:hypothetical protein
MMLEQDLEWDPVKEKVTNVPEANQFLARKMREPWARVYARYKV